MNKVNPTVDVSSSECCVTQSVKRETERMPVFKRQRWFIIANGKFCEEFDTHNSDEALPIASISADSTICRYTSLEAGSKFEGANCANFENIKS